MVFSIAAGRAVKHLYPSQFLQLYQNPTYFLFGCDCAVRQMVLSIRSSLFSCVLIPKFLCARGAQLIAQIVLAVLIIELVVFYRHERGMNALRLIAYNRKLHAYTIY
jgi:hypothetical protein